MSRPALCSLACAAAAALAACGSETPPDTPMVPEASFDVPDKDPEPLVDPADIMQALTTGGVEISKLLTQSTGEDGTVYGFDVDAAEALSTWQRVRALTNETGYYPVVCRDERGSLTELSKLNPTPPSKTVDAAVEIEASKWFDQRVAGDPDYYGGAAQGPWEGGEPQRGWVVPFDVLTGEPAEGVRIALVPTATPWKVLAYLHYGGWNECPAPEEHVAVHRLWHERFGAEVVCVSGDIVEMRVARPPTDRKAAVALAHQQFVYSGGDLIFQGYESLNALAAALIGARYWYFWWD